MLMKVTTMEGMEMLINGEQVMIAGPVSVDGKPVIGMTKVMFASGASIVVRMGMEELNEAISGRPRLSLA